MHVSVCCTHNSPCLSLVEGGSRLMRPASHGSSFWHLRRAASIAAINLQLTSGMDCPPVAIRSMSSWMASTTIFQPVAPPAKADPEALALRAQPRSVVRLNHRMLAVGVGTLTAAVLGGTLRSQQRARNPATELFNVDRIAKSEGLERLPKDYAGLSPALKAPPVVGDPLPGDLGPAIVKSQQPMEMRPPHGGAGGIDPAQAERLAAEEAARSSVFFRATGSSGGGTRTGSGAVAPVQSAAGSTAALPSSQRALNPMQPARPDLALPPKLPAHRSSSPSGANGGCGCRGFHSRCSSISVPSQGARRAGAVARGL